MSQSLGGPHGSQVGLGTSENIGDGSQAELEQPTSFRFDAASEEEIGLILTKYPPSRKASAVLPLLYVVQAQMRRAADRRRVHKGRNDHVSIGEVAASLAEVEEPIDEEAILDLVNKHFDLRPAAIIKELDLRRPIYQRTAAYGHFGRNDIDAPWEATDKAELLREDAAASVSS